MTRLLNEDWRAIVVDFKTEKEMAATALDGYPSMNPFVESLILLSQPNVIFLLINWLTAWSPTF